MPITCSEPKAAIMVCGQPISFLLNTGVTYLVLVEFWGPSSPSCFPIVGVGEQPYLSPQTPPLSSIFMGVPCTHSFLVVLTYSVPLSGRDLLAKLRASISFVPPICLNPSFPAVLLLLLISRQPSNTNFTNFTNFLGGSLRLGRPECLC